jgi:L-rhamnose mutarotase
MTLAVLTVDLKDDAKAIAAYRRYHAAVWPEVLASLLEIGVRSLEIYALGRRLVMLLETRPGFDAARDFARHAASDPRCAEWEELMKTFQQAPPGAGGGAGRLWTPMEEIFSLRSQLSKKRAKKRSRKQRSLT